MEELFTSDGCAYRGMDKETVERLRSELGKSTEWVTKEVYEQIVAEQLEQETQP